MKINSDHTRDAVLIDAVLQDDDWQAANAAFKARALGSFRARQRVRRVTRVAALSSACLLVLAVALHWFGRPAALPRMNLTSHIEPPKSPAHPRSLTDQELLAAFPKGTCFIAEVDGKKLLVFLDPQVKRAYLSDPGESAAQSQ